MKQNKSVELNYIYNLLYQIIVVIVPFITTPYVSRVLNANSIGIFSYTTAITGYFVLFGSLGIATYGQLKISEFRNDKYKMSKIFYELLINKIIITFIIIGFYLLFFNLKCNQNYKTMYSVLIIQILASAIDISWFLQGLEEFKKILIRNIIIKFLSVILIFSLVKQAEDLYLYALIINGSTLIGNLSIWMFARRYLEKVNINKLNLKKHIKPCIMYFIPTIATTIYLTLDKAMIGWFTSTSLENGYFEQANKVEQMALTVVTSLSVVTMPRMAYLFKNNKLSEFRLRLNESFRFILFISIPMCLGMFAISDSFIPLFLGKGYDKSIGLLKIFSLLLIIVGLNNAVGKQILMPIGRQKEYNRCVILGAIVNFSLNFLLIPRLYSIGAAIASVSAEMVILLTFIYYSRDFISLKWILKNSFHYVIAGLVMFVVICLSYRYFNISWISLFCQISIGSLIYGSVLLVMRDRLIFQGIAMIKKYLSKN